MRSSLARAKSNRADLEPRQDLLFDKAGRRAFPFFYYSVRTTFLPLALISTFFWGYYGWDGVIDQLWGGTYGVGVHWSTIQTFSVFFYLLMVNIHKGGVSFVTLLDSVSQDLKSVAIETEYRFRIKPRAAYLAEREKYRVEPGKGLDSMRAVCFCFLITAGALLLFECIWVPLYDYFNYGNWAWPVYFADVYKVGALPWGSYGFYRNVGSVLLGFGLAPAVFVGVKYDSIKQRSEIVRTFKVRWRFDGAWAGLVIIAAFMWLYWILAPFQHPVISQYQLSISSVINPLPIPQGLLSSPLIFPSMVNFPQTDYTFYPVADFMKGYPLDSVYGFYLQDNWIHLINVLTKYATYIAACYPAFVRLRPN